RAHFEILFTDYEREQQGRRRGLGLRLAHEAFAVPAVLTGADLQAVGIAVRAARIGRGHRERVVAERSRRLAEHQTELGGLERRQRIRRAAVRLERITLRPLHALDVAGFARYREKLLEECVIRLEVVVLETPILHGHVGRQCAAPVALLEVRAQKIVGGLEAPGLSVPVRDRSDRKSTRLNSSHVAISYA